VAVLHFRRVIGKVFLSLGLSARTAGGFAWRAWGCGGMEEGNLVVSPAAALRLAAAW
jgi:hypothetical protein